MAARVGSWLLQADSKDNNVASAIPFRRNLALMPTGISHL
jgi:hypothetical protein